MLDHTPERIRQGTRQWLTLVSYFLVGCIVGGCGERKKSTPKAEASVETHTGEETTAKPEPIASSPIRFEDRAVSAGVELTYDPGSDANNYSILSSLGGGCGLIDFDRDQDLDMFFLGGGKFGPQQQITGLPSSLFRNQGAWRFQNISGDSRISLVRHYTYGTAIADVDQDGFEDLLVTGYGGLQLWRNLGEGTFQDVTDGTGLNDTLWSTSAAWGDFNGDGNLDVYIAHYVNWSFQNDPVCYYREAEARDICSPKSFDPLPDTLYYSNGDGTFRDASAAAGLRKDGKGLGVVAADIDLDGKLDLYIGNDTVPNFLYHNLGQGKFEEIGDLSGTALGDISVPDGSMGVAVGDFNLDGLPDLWVANYETEHFALYRNDGNSTFLHVSQPLGITAVGSLFVGFGTVFFDVDRDGDEDIWVSNGHVILYPANAPLKQAPLLFENQAGKWFQNVAPLAGDYAAHQHMGRGVAKGDLDGDGDLDLVACHTGDRHAILENKSDNQNGWLQVQLIGTQSNRSAIGTRLTLKTSQGIRIRQISGGGSYLSHSDLRAFWGIPAGMVVEELTIQWPSGTTQVIAHPQTDRTLTIAEPSPQELNS